MLDIPYDGRVHIGHAGNAIDVFWHNASPLRAAMRQEFDCVYIVCFVYGLYRLGATMIVRESAFSPLQADFAAIME